MTIAAQLTAIGYSPAEVAEIVLFARKKAFPDQWIKVLAVAAVERLRYRQALALAFPASTEAPARAPSGGSLTTTVVRSE
jgi:hypothetical protein